MHTANKWLLSSTVILAIGCAYLGWLVLTREVVITEPEAEVSLTETVVTAVPGTLFQTSAADGSNPDSKTDNEKFAEIMASGEERVPQFMDSAFPLAQEKINIIQLQQAWLQYADLVKEFGLNTVDADRLVSLLAGDFSEALRFMRQNETDPENQQRLLQEAKKERHSEIQRMLGVDRYKRLTDYSKNLEDREIVATFRASIAARRYELPSDDQQKRLIAIVIEEKLRVPVPTFTRSGPHSNPFEENEQWHAAFAARVLQRTAGFLNETQQQILEQQLKAHESAMRL